MKFFLLLFFIISFPSLYLSIERLPDAYKFSGINEKLDKTIINSVNLYNSEGNKVDISDYFGNKPLLINFAYYTCPKLCHLVVSGMVDALSRLNPRLLNQVQILTISFDHRDTVQTTALFKDKYYSSIKEPKHWDFLYGDQSEVEKLAESIGYEFYFDTKNNMYSHPSALVFVSPVGIVSRYLYGIMYNPFDIKMAIIDSKQNKSRSTVDSMLLFCYNYDPTDKGYVIQAVNLMKIACLLTVVIFFGFLTYLKINEKNI